MASSWTSALPCPVSQTPSPLVKPFPFHSLWPFPRACLHLCEQLWEVPGHAGSFLGFPAAQTDGDQRSSLTAQPLGAGSLLQPSQASLAAQTHAQVSGAWVDTAPGLRGWVSRKSRGWQLLYLFPGIQRELST